MNHEIEITGGIDVGNGYVKGGLQASTSDEQASLDKVDFPSGVGLMTRPNFLPVADEEAPAIIGGDFYNELDASFTSPLVKDGYRRLFGRRGLEADSASVEVFDVVGNLSKAEQALSHVVVLGTLAARALRAHVEATGALPAHQLEVTARLGLALPIDEYQSHRKSYVSAFKSGTHLVTVHNFETPVSVAISFADVQVIAEGASAQFAITKKGLPLMEALLADVRARGMEEELAGITAADVLAAKNTIGIDVGEGTVNFPVFTGGKFNVDASRTFGKGYGSVLDGALKAMADQRFNTSFSTRKHLAEFLLAEPSPLKRNFYNSVKRFVDEEIEFFVNEVAEQFGRLLRVSGAMTEVAYVYGGGSGPIREALHPALLSKVVEMNSEGAFPVMYLDAAYSRHLNREGLFIAAQTVAAQAKAAQKQQ